MGILCHVNNRILNEFHNTCARVLSINISDWYYLPQNNDSFLFLMSLQFYCYSTTIRGRYSIQQSAFISRQAIWGSMSNDWITTAVHYYVVDEWCSTRCPAIKSKSSDCLIDINVQESLLCTLFFLT
jgi:hypothetical protein